MKIKFKVLKIKLKIYLILWKMNLFKHLKKLRKFMWLNKDKLLKDKKFIRKN